jgi:hypothetical protein
MPWEHRSLLLNGTLWGELGLGWLGCKPQSADEIDRMLQNRRHRPFPPFGLHPVWMTRG